MAAFENFSGDREMLEYTQAGGGLLIMLILHDDTQRKYAYCPAKVLPNPAARKARRLVWRRFQ